jgi:hypothetical protein
MIRAGQSPFWPVASRHEPGLVSAWGASIKRQQQANIRAKGNVWRRRAMIPIVDAERAIEARLGDVIGAVRAPPARAGPRHALHRIDTPEGQAGSVRMGRQCPLDQLS